ncbi:monocarboxylate transporter 12 isoform X1 [Odontomachus brunneus]|uniref:monocarboxylate transporter 12 isoform X1 n=1 Tax=Odontomachus brunneus TaxID=486640 RepID=UPI0013F287E8|nr:monocarboxylate transporter 12 isoform X1 [Odontomachus brunneus]XP_032667088.1 monocarboxylate transporter 12 isoform X1 [Odontomachus brunneus]XP_032667089.1 monocarboxylate transporter 12 isoform X1 [Odontomachus brunneus]XP_032667090.1 monocarboxylate transporter 12 isoform X1 [Odontomachus brunneus]XP_032667091.1 monocarboxylate transporter 12 isoform X1 [Odontomachus brunneus]XP_032667092.1 monocarboxylate transporter 12 isoform X1 [Odontomachus brunneus]XP_032667093.1 monocarboxylat
MSATQASSKVDEQVSANKPQQNGHGCNKSEELQLEDVNDNNNDETIEVEMVVPPDGGWGWVIVAASFMCNLFVDGIIFSFGVFLNDIADAFGVSKARVALVGSLQTGFYLMVGPFVSALANRYGFRLVAILGSVISCSAFVLSYFSTSIEFLYISYGCIGGIGGGLIYVPAVITTGFYFERWRALATGIAVCGSGIGAFLLAPISDLLVQNFGWRGALLFQAGMLLNCAIFGAMFRPLKPTRIKVKSTPENAALEVKTTLMGKGVSTASLHCVQPNRSGFFGTNNNTEYPTAAEILGSSPNIVNASKSLHSLHKVHVEPQTLELKVSSSEKRLSVPVYSDLDAMNNEEKIAEENNLLSGDLERLNGKVPTTRRHTISGRRLRADSECSQKSLRSGKRNQPNKDPQRPFYRDDIFYGGSLNRLPHYKSQQSSVGYHMSVTRLPTTTDVAEEESGSCYLCPESVRRILTTMLDLSLLKSPSFLILAISGGLTMMGFYTPFMYVPDRAKKANIDASTAMFLVSVIGIGNTIGRIVCGLASSLPGVNALVVNNVFISIGGLLTIFSGLSLTEGYQFFYAAGFGLSISVFASLRSILVVDLLGLEKLTNAFGLLLLFQGVAAAMGAPLAGAFMDATGSYDASFYLSGSLILLSAVICYPLKRINTWERRGEQKPANQDLSKS